MSRNPSPHMLASGLALVEMLVVVAIVAVLAALIYQALHKMMDASYAAKCAGSFRQLGIGIAMYASENDGSLPPRQDYDVDASGTVNSIKPYWKNASSWLYQYLDSGWPKSSQLGLCPADRTRDRSQYYWIHSDNFCFLVSYVNGVPDKNGTPGDLTNNGYGRKIKLAEASKKMLMVEAIDMEEAISWRGGAPLPKPSASGANRSFLWNSSLRSVISSRHKGKANSLWGDGSVRQIKFTDLSQKDIERDQP